MACWLALYPRLKRRLTLISSLSAFPQQSGRTKYTPRSLTRGAGLLQAHPRPTNMLKQDTMTTRSCYLDHGSRAITGPYALRGSCVFFNEIKKPVNLTYVKLTGVVNFFSKTSEINKNLVFLFCIKDTKKPAARLGPALCADLGGHGLGVLNQRFWPNPFFISGI
jgi:hypothetical protein